MKRLRIGSEVVTLVLIAWLVASSVEWATGIHLVPWPAYGACGYTSPSVLPLTVKVGLYEEFPDPWRLDKLRLLDFPVSLAVASSSREQFLARRDSIVRAYPVVREVYFWPLLKPSEGYYPGTWSDASAVSRVADEASGLPVLWDLEMPRDAVSLSPRNWYDNRSFVNGWLQSRSEVVHIWRPNSSMGLDPPFLAAVGMHFDPLDYRSVWMHLDLYETGSGLPAEQMAKILRCGVERYGSRFIPSFGVLDDGYGSPSEFVSAGVLRRDLSLARAAGVSEVWLFGVNGLTESVVRTIRETLPVGTDRLIRS